MEITYHSGAKKEMREAAAYYESKVDGLGNELLEEIRETIERIASHPLIYAPILDEIRRVNLKRFPYAIIFETVANRLQIYAVMHARRKPMYWKRRAKDAD